jgi:uncharacterized protein (TIGR01777 family)
MRIVIAGGSGLLGRALTRRLVGQEHDVAVLGRHAGGSAASGRQVVWTPDGTVGTWAREIDGADVVVNLAGAGIADKRWTPGRKVLLRSSRLDSTRSLVAAVAAAVRQPRVFIQGSAVGYYGSTVSAAVVDETSPAGTDFLADLAAAWEGSAAPVSTPDCRLVIVRTCVVLTRAGGALPPMSRPFRFFVGGPIGTGQQYLSWITIDDWISLVLWAIATPEAQGVINATAPHPVTNAVFSAALAGALHRPNLFTAPSTVLAALFGEMAKVVLLGGQRAVPARALALGFQFQHAEIQSALAHALGTPVAAMRR